MTRLFRAGERGQAVRTLVGALRADARVDDLDLFASVAEGSADRHSDVDLAVIVADDVRVPTVAEEWAGRVHELLPVFDMFSESFGPVELRGFLLENFLEIDLLPAELRDDLETTVVGSLDPHDLTAALRAATRTFFAEARTTQPELAERLEPRLLAFLDLIAAAPGAEVR